LAQNADAGLRNLEFVPGDICQLPFESHALDAVVCRFVLHHLGAAAPKALSEMVRVLKPGGLICVIDVDGLLLKLHPQTPRVATVLDRLKAQAGVDLQMGRKIPGILATLSVENLRWEVMPYRSSEAGMQQEASLMEERFRAAAPLLAEVCGSPDEAQHFVAEYLQTLRSPGSVYFHSKFRITGTAPVSAGGSVAR
jgi:SAM-dependent methyltransferase